MEIEKLLTVPAPPSAVWALLLDPAVMGACVPGMKSIEVVSDVEYLAEMHVKIAFVSARFKIKTTIVETRPPHYLRSEGTGEDASVASSLKQVSEIFLSELPDGQTELRMKIKVDVLGRLGTFGLSVMKTKADRMWDEFGVNLAARLAPAPAADASSPGLQQQDVQHAAVSTPLPEAAAPGPDLPPAVTVTQRTEGGADRSWLSRLFSPAAARRQADEILVEVRKPDSVVTIRWPARNAQECAQWLHAYLKD
ncbi:MAG: Carbon monoxide oxidation accessory protein CoxG [Polaromonas sp.]|nr:Carbon monoxide oxidation accessory protein CoxG [Polaromonas sp.]